MHLCKAMLLPRPEAFEQARRFAERGKLEFEGATLERRGKAAFVTMRHPRFLNSEDESTVDGLETAIDVATLDPATDIAVLRGDTVEHTKYRGRRLFSAGINLTHLYHGKISYVWYIKRDMGLVNKLFRGVARADSSPDELIGGSVEKPWIGVVDGFAIGGGCQLLLVLDYVLAASDAYLTLPARKEGIIPGAANLRLWRFTGDRIARQAILYGRRLDCDTPEGRLICDEIAPTDSIDAALDTVIDGFTSSGVVSAAGNRRAIRVEPGAARYVSPLHGGLCARAGLLPFQPGADRQSGAELERAEPRALKLGVPSATRNSSRRSGFFARSLSLVSKLASVTCIESTARQAASRRASMVSRRPSALAGAEVGQCASRSLAASLNDCLTFARVVALRVGRLNGSADLLDRPVDRRRRAAARPRDIARLILILDRGFGGRAPR